MKKCIALIGVLVATALGSSTVWAKQQTSDEEILKLNIEMIAEGPIEYNYVETQKETIRNECTTKKERFDLQELITLGEKIWQIVKDGAPTLNFASNSASAVPASAVCAFNLSGWSIPYSRTYKLYYENLYGSKVVEFTYKLIFSYGGNYQGRGAYLANVTIHPVDVQVGWGQNFDASVSIANVLNVGQADDPIAGMEVALEWNVKNVLNNFKSRRIYFIDGKGNATEL
ncbi:MAG: hypothetical protein IT287_04695 [Bdellovibrionaceae bacterium]|nr:hypothetical protein [Pseudobdellovibrionaceae bacterium]